jgi:hypothetical protein
MNELNCEYVREIYPDVLRGTADANAIATVRAHLAGCADCRVEAELIERLYVAPVTVPAGLQERVLAGVRSAPAGRRFAARHVALAATVAAVLIGGPALLDSLRTPETPGGAAATISSGLGVVTVEAALVTGTGSLQDLTVEELEQLLGEIES